jgi:lysyl-tRNA synthetase class 2
LDISSREYFLTHLWQAYPPMPSQAQAYGRIFSLDLNEGLKLRLAREGVLSEVSFARAPALAKILREGDLVAVLDENEIVLLAPALRALPRPAFDRRRQELWNHFIATLSEFFVSDDFHEMKTPTLVACPGTEPSLDVFSTELKIGSRRQKLFLPTSPELHLKKVLSLGAEKIFEIAPCFRNGEITEKHQPEFTLLEWYRAYDRGESIRQDVEKLVAYLSRKLKVPGPRRVSRYTVTELFQKYLQFDLLPETSLAELKSLAEKTGVDARSAESIDDYFFLIFMDKIESRLPFDELIFVEKYPPYQAALARLTEDGWGDRFEVYWKGLELANAFHELNDPRIQRQRFNEDLQKKKQMGKEEIPLDEEFLQCLEAGLPPSAGIALGVERLFMAFYDVPRISDLKLFPYE